MQTVTVLDSHKFSNELDFKQIFERKPAVIISSNITIFPVLIYCSNVQKSHLLDSI